MIRKIFIAFAIVTPLCIAGIAQLWPPAWWAMTVVGPIVLLGIRDMTQRKHALLRVYPVLGHGRYLMEEIRPEIQQYFVESNTDGTPFNRESRSVVYQRAKKVKDKVPFGTQLEVDEPGYEWIPHSMCPAHIDTEHLPTIAVGQEKVYQASLLNISAMSFGSLSHTAVQALNRGAKLGGFAHNTGEGGVSPYHEQGGDLIWQLGTGYFGARKPDGRFCPDRFQAQASLDAVKMIEVKISQGAKPGHGGILPGDKVTPEIAGIRGVEVGKTVNSPPKHPEFNTPIELLEFVAHLRSLSGGKPVGIKICVGNRTEFFALCKAMLHTDIAPDYIFVDGGEGGTGAAPLEFSNYVGMPLRDGLHFVNTALKGVGLRDRIKIMAAGKISTGFDLVRAIALGADFCASARAMMFALGCIQARKCHTNHCPVGIATQERWRANAIDVEKRSKRVASYHRETLESMLDLIGTAGLHHPRELGPYHVQQRVSKQQVLSYSELYGTIAEGAYLRADASSLPWQRDWEQADHRSFQASPSASLRAMSA